ncbi:MAG: transcription elongation factor GreA [Bacilli bacterium]|jgi:transcription elongation factor GreA
MDKEFILTKEGVEQLQDELKRLKEVERAEVVQQLREARAQGDLSENAEYDAARNKQAQIEGRIIELENMLSNARIIHPKNGGVRVVRLGATVVIKNHKTGKESEFIIVGSVEADPRQGKISNESALAKAILNHGQNETVTVKAVEPYEVTILSIKR